MSVRDFAADKHDPNTARAEELVAAWLRQSYGGAVEDARDRHGPYDYALHLTYDVKCSRWLAREGRVHYEYRHVYRDGRERDGWSVNPALQYVVYVNPDTWAAYVIRMRAWRAHVEDRLWHAQEQGRDAPLGWIPSVARNHDYETLAWSMPLTELQTVGGIVTRAACLAVARD